MLSSNWLQTLTCKVWNDYPISFSFQIPIWCSKAPWWPKQTMLSTHHPCFILIFTLLKVTYTISFVSPDVSQKASSLYSIVSLDFSASLLHLNIGIVEGYCLGFTGSQAESTFSCKQRQDGHSGTGPVLRRVEKTDHESAWATKWDIVLKKKNKTNK